MKYLNSALIASFFSLLIINPAQAQLATDLQCANCVGTSDIQGGSVTTGKIAPASVTTARLAPLSVGSGKIQANAVTSGKIKDFAVGTVKIKTQAITTGKLQDGAVTEAKLDSALQAALATIADLEERIEALEANSVLALDGALTMDTLHGNPVARFQGVNVQVVNGQEDTDSVNGLGNLIVGYDEAETVGDETCSDGQYTDSESCLAGGEIWGVNYKSGSHNLVLGKRNTYGQYAGIVTGNANKISAAYASVVGGTNNRASGSFSTVSGGQLNFAVGFASSVSGGRDNIASGTRSSVSGGQFNAASSSFASVSGGSSNIASGGHSSVSGGFSNTASGAFSSVSGGSSLEASAAGGWEAPLP